MEVDPSIDDGGDAETEEIVLMWTSRKSENEGANFDGMSCAADNSEPFPESLQDAENASKSEELQSYRQNDGCNIIKPIDKNVVHRICSGQVVVTLATAVKELVENSIDAGASNIDIRLVEYGSKSIEVTDNGCGVEEANFEGLGLKHHTSKIRDFEDLTSIETFGFRGEALSSLCALSNLSVITKSSQSVGGKGYRIEYDLKGRIAKKTQCARDVGTTVVIKNLFSTLPVRHVEFLKNLKREFTRMVAVLYGYCLITAGVRINCTNLLESGTVSKVLSIPGSVSVREKIVCLFGSKQLESLVEIKAEENVAIDEAVLEEFGLKGLCGGNPYRFQGFISLPYKGRGASDRQFFFFNSRPCDPAKLSRIVNEVYHAYSKSQYPFIFLDIRTTQENLDVNVTPDKRQIYVRNEKILYAAVKFTVMSVLTKAASSFGAGNSTSLKFSSGFVDPLLPDDNDDDDERSNITAYEGNSVNKDDSVLQQAPCSSNLVSSERIPREAGSTSMHREPGNMRSFLKDFSYKSKPAFGKTVSEENQYKEQDERVQSRSPSRKRISLNGGGKSILDFFKSKEKRRRIENYSEEDDVIVLEDEQEKTRQREYDNWTNEMHDNVEVESPHSENDSRAAQISKYYSPTKKSSYNDERIMVKNKQPSNEDDDVIVVYDDEFGEEAYSRVISLGGDQVNLEDCTIKLYGNAAVVNCAINWPDIRRRNLNSGTSSNKTEPQNEGRRFRATISSEENQRAEEELRKQIKKEMFPEMEVIGQFNLGFILVKHGPDIFIVDQHATDEKYNFEDLEKNTVLQTQKLICPVELQLPTVSQGIVLDNLEIFRKNGFDFFVQDDDSSIGRIQLTQIPYSKCYEFGKQDIDELIFLLEDAPDKAFYRPSRVRDMLASRACRKSVMIGTHLNGNEMRRIVDHMALMDQPWNCPHGRPTIRHLLNLNMIFVDNVYAFPH